MGIGDLHGDEPEIDVPDSHRLALIGLVLGLGGALLALIPWYGAIIAPVPAILAIIFGVVGIVRSRRNGGPGVGPSIASIALGLAAIPVQLASIALYASLG